jgi:NAD-dependent deacetylase
MLMTADLSAAVELLRSARYAVALTGAGVSTPSGIPDFRSADSGLWNDVNPMIAASLVGFRLRPKEFYRWARPLARLIVEAEPNPAHFALAELERHGILKALITQNIDLLHERAGSKVVYEVHGHIREATCMRCRRVYPSADFVDEFVYGDAFPRCPRCKGLLKPNVILFGESLPREVINRAYHAARLCDLMLVVGSSLTVTPVSELPAVALSNGAQLIMISKEPTHFDRRARVVIHEDAADLLPRLVDLLNEAA